MKKIGIRLDKFDVRMAYNKHKPEQNDFPLSDDFAPRAVTVS